jgi:hypothetical protein
MVQTSLQSPHQTSLDHKILDQCFQTSYPKATDLLEYAFFHQILTENDSSSSDIREGKSLINTPPKE